MDFSYLITPVILISFIGFGSLFYKLDFLPHLADSGHRYDYIDGLRGLAALLVVCSHSWRFRDIGFINDQITKADYFYMGNMGAVGVQLFFCITGFLFFKKIIKEGTSINWVSFYKARIKRLTPLYFVFCISVVGVGIYISGLQNFNSSALTSAAKL
ncbi:acyltransferase family protein, partial [Erwinia billingiae]